MHEIQMNNCVFFKLITFMLRQICIDLGKVVFKYFKAKWFSLVDRQRGIFSLVNLYGKI